MSETLFYNARNLVGIGSVGIGTANPATILHTYDSANNSELRVQSTGGGAVVRVQDSTGSGFMKYNNNLQLWAGNPPSAATMSITNQFVGIGTANPSVTCNIFNTVNTSSQTLSVDSGNNTTGGDTVQIYKRSTNNYCIRLDSIPATYPATFIYFAANAGTANPGAITATNSVTMSYGTGSDYRLKSNVVPLSNSIEFVNKLRPVYFTFNCQPTEVVGGFIAHEFQELLPSAVTGVKDDVDENGNMRIQNIDVSFEVPYITAAVQELSAENTALKARLDSLEARLVALEAHSVFSSST